MLKKGVFHRLVEGLLIARGALVRQVSERLGKIVGLGATRVVVGVFFASFDFFFIRRRSVCSRCG